MKRVLVTGANGYIGRKVLSTLLEKGAEVVAVDTCDEQTNKQAEYIKGDLFDPDSNVLSKIGSIDACVHLAWRNGFSHNDRVHMTDLSSHFLFLANMIDKGVEQVATMGSMHEIGYWEGAVDENTPCNPQSFYGISKDSLRRSFIHSAQSTNTKALWLRAFYIIGDELRSQSVFGRLFRAAQQGDKSFPLTSGENCYDFIGIEELSNQIVACVLQNKIDGIINCCTGKPVSLATKIEQFIVEHDLSISIEYGAYPDREYDSPAIWGDATKINMVMSESEKD